jgi:hypothetical protein
VLRQLGELVHSSPPARGSCCAPLSAWGLSSRPLPRRRPTPDSCRLRGEHAHLRMTKDCRGHGGALVSTPCGAIGMDVSVVDLTLNERLFRESTSGQFKPSKRWQGEGSCSVGRLGGSSRRGGSLHPSEAPGPPGVMRERVTR